MSLLVALHFHERLFDVAEFSDVGFELFCQLPKRSPGDVVNVINIISDHVRYYLVGLPRIKTMVSHGAMSATLGAELIARMARQLGCVKVCVDFALKGHKT